MKTTMQGGSVISVMGLMGAVLWLGCGTPDPWAPGGTGKVVNIDELVAKAREGDQFSAVHLGWRYDTGTGVVQDYEKAYQWYYLSLIHI